MKVLKEISEQTLNFGISEQFGHTYELRKSARAILENDIGQIAVQHISKNHFHKLPGGGINQGETIEEALSRELREEVGCEITICSQIGIVIEYRNKYNLIQISYAYHCRVLGLIGTPTLEPDEVTEGMHTLWCTPEEAITLLKQDTPKVFEGHFILAREISILEEFLSSI